MSAYSNDKLYFDGIAGIPVTGSYNSSTKTLTLTGTATLAQYEQVIEAVKHQAPIWKQEHFIDGHSEWSEGCSLCVH